MRFCATILLCFLVASAYGQKYVDDDTPYNFRDRAYGGLGLGGLGFGSHSTLGNYFSIGVSALGGYMLTKNLSTGIGFEYQYTSYGQADIKNHVYGGYPFVRYNIKNFFLQADYNMYNIEIRYRDNKASETSDHMLVGIGFSSPTRGRGYFNFLVSYDFLYSSTSPWGSPLNTRMFFTF